jgi:ribonuclease HI
MGSQVEVYDAELEGIYQATRMVCGQRRFKKRIIIFSDNQAAVQTAGQLGPGPGRQRARQLHDLAIQQITNGGSIQVEWVPGHYNVDGNELADTLAKAVVQKPADPGSITYLYRQVKADHNARWKNGWETMAVDLKGRSYVGDWKQAPDKLFLEDRMVCSTVIPLCTGHGHFGSYLHTMKFRPHDSCTCRNKPRETPNHLLFHCLRYSKDRLAAAKSSRIPFHIKAFLYSGIAHKALAELIRNTQIGTRFERLEKEKAVGEGERDGVIGRGENWDNDEVEDDLTALAEELKRRKVGERGHTKRAYPLFNSDK